MSVMVPLERVRSMERCSCRGIEDVKRADPLVEREGEKCSAVFKKKLKRQCFCLEIRLDSTVHSYRIELWGRPSQRCSVVAEYEHSEGRFGQVHP